MGIKDVRTRLIVSSVVEAVYDPTTTLAKCRQPYKGNPHGCPKWGKKADCPPNADNFLKEYSPRVRVVAVELDLEEYDAVRILERPDLPRGVRLNQRQWQPNLRVRLRKAAEESLMPGEQICFNPEAMGVDVTETCKRAGLELQWPKRGEPRTRVDKVALLVRPKE